MPSSTQGTTGWLGSKGRSPSLRRRCLRLLEKGSRRAFNRLRGRSQHTEKRQPWTRTWCSTTFFSPQGRAFVLAQPASPPHRTPHLPGGSV